MGFAGLLGPAVSLIGSAASGGKGGSSAGVSPEQAMLAQYQAQQSKLKHAATFANTGTEMSTGLTTAQAGSNTGQALAEATQADTNAAQALAANSPLQNLAQQQAGNQSFNQGAQDFSNQSGNTFESIGNQTDRLT